MYHQECLNPCVPNPKLQLLASTTSDYSESHLPLHPCVSVPSLQSSQEPEVQPHNHKDLTKKFIAKDANNTPCPKSFFDGHIPIDDDYDWFHRSQSGNESVSLKFFHQLFGKFLQFRKIFPVFFLAIFQIF